LRSSTSDVRNIRAFLITTIYRSFETADNWFSAKVKHDTKCIGIGGGMCGRYRTACKCHNSESSLYGILKSLALSSGALSIRSIYSLTVLKALSASSASL
ncbi:MAG: hypothetical protein SOW78_03580, partial [Clostridia bacterium]|nr:hypothetical protein [Clostridia bacterium]